MEYFLDQDNDGHWYIIPLNKINEWNNWFNSEDYDNGIVPDYVEEVGGCPSNVIFKNYKVI